MTVLAADKIPAPFPENSETAISAWCSTQTHKNTCHYVTNLEKRIAGGKKVLPRTSDSLNYLASIHPQIKELLCQVTRIWATRRKSQLLQSLSFKGKTNENFKQTSKLRHPPQYFILDQNFFCFNFNTHAFGIKTGLPRDGHRYQWRSIV